MSKILFAFALTLLCAGGAPAQTGSVQITGAWARATPAKAENGGAYLTLEATTGDRLIGASAPIAAKAELHRMTMTNGIMKMRQLASIDLPPGKKVTLKPGALHIMLIGLKKPLETGQTFPLTLDFAKAGKREVTVTVEKIASMGPDMTAGSGMKMPMHH
jgi:periplasmic copper chaperone A